MTEPPASNTFGLFRWSALNPPADPTTSFAGKTVLITGANTGLGFEAALKFARLGASTLILGVRSLQRGETAQAEICKQTGYSEENIKLIALDMGEFSSIEAFVKELSTKTPQLDVVILNAGVAPVEYTLSAEGYEMTLQVNVISTAILAVILLPLLRGTAVKTGSLPHLVIVGSTSHLNVTPEMLPLKEDDKLLDKVSSKSFFNANHQYAYSKLLVMYVMEGLLPLTRKPDGSPEVIVTTVCPGLCMSDLFRSFPFLTKIIWLVFMYFFSRTAEQGSRTIISGAALGADAHGQFWAHDRFFRYDISSFNCARMISNYVTPQARGSSHQRPRQRSAEENMGRISRTHAG